MENLNLYIILMLLGIIIGGAWFGTLLIGVLRRSAYPAATPLLAGEYAYRDPNGMRLLMTMIAMALLYFFLVTQQPTIPTTDTMNGISFSTDVMGD